MKNIFLIPSLIALVITTLLLSACGPTYTTRNEYIPPNTPQALACLQQCDTRINTCQNSCDTKKRICMERASKIASLTLPLEEKEYVNKLERYIAEKKHYDLEKNEYQHQFTRLEMDYDVYSQKCKEDSYFCTRQKEIKQELRTLKYAPRIKAPMPPSKPTLASETRRHQANCSVNCDCKLRYDSCYTSCGGRIVPYKICTSNCPAKK